MQLTEHFNLSEFTKSQQAVRHGIDNTPNPQQVENLRQLCINVLEPIRVWFKKPVFISSGFRNEAVNSMAGGSKTSDHMKGEAADIEIFGIDNCALALWIKENCKFNQLILEFHNHAADINSGWIHVSYRSSNNKNEVLTARRLPTGKTQYLPGLVI